MGTVTVKINLDKTGYSAGITDTRRQAKQLADSLKAAGAEGASSIGVAQRGAEQLGKSLQTAGAHGVTSMQASSAAIRTLEGGMQNSIRAAERFIGTIPGVGAALQTAFPVVGAIAVAGIIAKIGEEAYRSIEKVREMGSAMRQGFDQVTSSGRLANDELSLSNVKLQNEIDKLEHKPANHVADALAEAKVQADQLYDSLRKDNEEIAKVLEANQAGFLAQVMGKAPSGDVKQSIQDQMTQLQTIGREARDETDPKEREKDNARLMERMKTAVAWIENAKLANPNGTAGGVDFSGNFAALDAAESVIKQRFDNMQLQKTHNALTGTKEGIGDPNSAQALLLKQDEEQEKQQNAFNKMTINEEIQFWTDRIAAFTGGGEQYIAVQDKIYDLIAKRPSLFAVNKKNQAEVGKSQVEGSDILGNAQKALITGPAIEQLGRAARSNETYDAMVAKGAEAQAKATAAYREASIAIGLQEGTLSKLAAAQALAKVHEDEHAAAIAAVNKELRDQLAIINGDSNLKGDDLARAKRNANQAAAGQTDQINSAYAATRQQDAASIYSRTSSGEAADTYRTMMQDWSDMTANIAAAMTKAADSFNSDIAAAITGHGKKGDFGKTFSTLGESLVKASLQKGESALFGGGQLGASQNNPVWTRDAASAVGVARSAAPNLGPFIRPFFGGQQGQGGGGGGIGGFFHTLMGGLFKLPGSQGGGGSAGAGLGDIGIFGGGGDFMANHPMIVGDKGPELLTPGFSGRVTPNDQLGGSHDTHLHFNIQGNQDPMAIEAAIRRAAPHIAAATLQAHHSSTKRSPHGR